MPKHYSKMSSASSSSHAGYPKKVAGKTSDARKTDPGRTGTSAMGGTKLTGK